MNLFQDKKTGRRIAGFLCVGMLALMIPVFVIAMYNRPSADDYVYAAQTYGVVQQSGADWTKLLQTALDTDLYFYNNWQGLYVSAFLLALQPGIFGGHWYAVTTFFIVALLFLGGICSQFRTDRTFTSGWAADGLVCRSAVHVCRRAGDAQSGGRPLLV